jgi:hypothetical protein
LGDGEKGGGGDFQDKRKKTKEKSKNIKRDNG